MTCPKCKKEIPKDAVLCCYCGKKLAEIERRARKRPNGAGTVYKLKGRRSKPWVAARKGVILGLYATKAEAQYKLDSTAGKPIGDGINLTMEEIHTLWWAEHQRDISADTVEAYEMTWKLFDQLKAKKFRNIRTDDVQELIDHQVRQERSRSQCEKIRTLYSQLCKYAIKKDIIDRNYAEFLRLPKQKKKQRLTFTPDDIKLIKEESGTNETAKLVMILIYTGLRINELLMLPMSGVDLEHSIIIGGEKTAAGRDRTVPILPEIYDDVAYFYRKSPGRQLIDGYDGNRDAHNFRNRDFVPLLERLGIRTADRPFTPHCCRYTFATMAATAGLDPEALKRILGHSKYETTSDIYIQDDTDYLISEMKKIGG
ncbi:MAG: tyrosine-type recombinase/integrase [Clostridiales bacterium]|nr:tyrosine-type recombinase/integrase [Clostridiales bacterium]MDY4037618.1 tyrosine-type recombinase/integrase [Candidatus Pseudoscilispira sp.]